MHEIPGQTEPSGHGSIIWRTWHSRRIVLLGLGLIGIYLTVQIVTFSALDNLFLTVGFGALLSLIAVRGLCGALGSNISTEFSLDTPAAGDLLGAALLAIFSLIPTSILAGLSADIHPPRQQWVDFYNANLPQSLPMIILSLLIVTTLVPLIEEIIFRGIFYRVGRRHWGFGGSALISALIFGLVHGEPWFLFGLAGLGLLLAFVYETTRSVTACALTHGIHNGVSLIYMLHDGGLGDDARTGQSIPWLLLAISLIGLTLVIVRMQGRRLRD